MSHDLEDAKYDAMFQQTRERVSRTRDVLDTSVANNVTFRLSSAVGPLNAS